MGADVAPPPRVCAGQEVVRPGGEQFEGPLVFTPEAVAVSSLGRSFGPFLVTPRRLQHSLEEVGGKVRDLFPSTCAGLGGSDSAPGGGGSTSPRAREEGWLAKEHWDCCGGDWLPEQEGEGPKLLTSAGAGSCEACPASPTYQTDVGPPGSGVKPEQVIAMWAFQGEAHT